MSDINNSPVKTIAVFDLETNGLPAHQGNTCAITELCLYAFPATCLTENAHDEVAILKACEGMNGIENLSNRPPQLPRVLHKLTLMINPEKEIHPIAAQMSGLTNAILSQESPFDAKTADCLLLFLERLEKPICFVAHNGWTFDYPIIRYVLETINRSIPSSIYCVDSFKAFRELDERHAILQTIKTLFFEQDELVSVINNKQEATGFALQQYQVAFSEPFQPKYKFPKKGQYILGNIFERVFQQPPENLHRAESDVVVLTQLILYYGVVFLAYIEQRKQSFGNVPKLGSRSV